MTARIPCIQCGAEILPETHARTGGTCMACKQGIRKSLENSKKFYQKQREYDPYADLWKSLIHRVYKTEKGLEGLTPEEKLYWSVSVLVGEVYNGGMYQFFSNSSGKLFLDVAAGLKTFEADRELALLLNATTLLFDNTNPPEDRAERWDLMRKYPEDDKAPEPEWCKELKVIDQSFCKDADKIREKLRQFAESKGLITPFLKAD